LGPPTFGSWPEIEGVVAEFVEQEATLLAAYFGREPTPAQRSRVVLYRAMSDLLWSRWGLLQVARDNQVDHFEHYHRMRLARRQMVLRDPGFADHMAAVARV
jgi:thiamine kinase-like enzyme